MSTDLLTKDSPLRRWLGPLTSELLQRPGEFGLGQVPARLRPQTTTSLVCGFCSTGCSLKAHLCGDEAVNLSPDPDYPVNLGMACPKGWEALTPLSAADRATAPLLRDPVSGALEPVSWTRAMEEFVRRFKALIGRHGPESVAFLSSGQICTEEMALLGALFKFGIGGLHCDSNTRQCMATSATAYKQSFGFDAPPYTYADFEQSDVIVLIGANLCIAHPILWQRVLRNRRSPKIIVVDPRATETAMGATTHLAIRPKSDLVLFYGVAHLLITNGWIARQYVEAHTNGFAAFAEFVRQFTPDRVAAETGLTVGQIHRFAETIARGKAVSFWWTMGVNQGHESTRTAQAIINLALMTGDLGRPGTGANSITGQCNAMGSRLYSNTTTLLGGRDFTNPAHREEVARVLGIPLERIPQRPSWAYDEIIKGVDEGGIKGLWIIGTNPAHSWIGRGGVDDRWRKLDFLVVQDMYHSTDTARHAHLLLPAAGWGEKEGTFINSERRFGLLKKVARAPGQALSDFHIFRLVAHHWGCGELLREWHSPEAVFQLLKRLSRGRPCDITGIANYAMLDACGGVQWPWRVEDGVVEHGSNGVKPPMRSTTPPLHHSAPPRERRLFEDGRFFTSDGRARFIFDSPRAVPESPDAEYPFVLMTGRGTSAQWHTQTRTGKSDVLRRLAPENLYVELNPRDAGALGIAGHEVVEVVSRRGSLLATAFLTPTVRCGQVFLPMHYAATNLLTYPAFDPHSRQPAYKHCAVRLRRWPGKPPTIK